VYDIDWLAVWCVQYRHNFGHVRIPKDLDVPPALGQTKITVSVWMFCNMGHWQADGLRSGLNIEKTECLLLSGAQEAGKITAHRELVNALKMYSRWLG
jgi:hypothetical protein